MYGLMRRPSQKTLYKHMNAMPSTGQINILTMEMIDKAIMNGFVNITRLGGYIILCSICSGCFTLLPSPPIVSAILSGFTEITTGLKYLNSLELSIE